jgi:hypothetical protein
MNDTRDLITFHKIHEMLSASMSDDRIRDYLWKFNSYLMEAIEFYEKEVGIDCKFYKAGVKQMALDISRREAEVVSEAMSLLREVCSALFASSNVQALHGNSLRE